VSPKSGLGFLCAVDSAVHQEFWILPFQQGVSQDAEVCWRHCFSIVELSLHENLPLVTGIDFLW
jgi:hypothetical protein